ncbi:hypothetical protein NDK43_06825 [Neobacillus pocheonensis]|uniref:Uncharacterized protein n=1 Tax=Neobacillus pocheonensis TaxID=363869 RepID=A0ABT0W825_9BACI|nr:hypothetical protein [Neobacillus pocheonensis]
MMDFDSYRYHPYIINNQIFSQPRQATYQVNPMLTNAIVDLHIDILNAADRANTESNEGLQSFMNEVTAAIGKAGELLQRDPNLNFLGNNFLTFIYLRLVQFNKSFQPSDVGLMIDPFLDTVRKVLEITRIIVPLEHLQLAVPASVEVPQQAVLRVSKLELLKKMGISTWGWLKSAGSIVKSKGTIVISGTVTAVGSFCAWLYANSASIKDWVWDDAIPIYDCYKRTSDPDLFKKCLTDPKEKFKFSEEKASRYASLLRMFVSKPGWAYENNLYIPVPAPTPSPTPPPHRQSILDKILACNSQRRWIRLSFHDGTSVEAFLSAYDLFRGALVYVPKNKYQIICNGLSLYSVQNVQNCIGKTATLTFPNNIKLSFKIEGVDQYGSIGGWINLNDLLSMSALVKDVNCI